jgi:hypothetical protein
LSRSADGPRGSELGATGLCCSQGVLGAPGDNLCLLLGDHRKNADDHLVYVWIIRCHELHSRILEIDQERRISAKAIQLRDNERGTVYATCC